MSKTNTSKQQQQQEVKSLKRSKRDRRNTQQQEQEQQQEVDAKRATETPSPTQNVTNKTMLHEATYNAGIGGGSAVRRIRTPHPHDVLSGRGGSINSHKGNVQFREWVAKRKNDYNLAPSKQDKARVAREVIALVQQQSPPGRFLQKDPTSSHGTMSWWIEIDDDRIMAKTSQALREGAPEIRKKHQGDSHVRHAMLSSLSLPKTRSPTTLAEVARTAAAPAITRTLQENMKAAANAPSPPTAVPTADHVVSQHAGDKRPVEEVSSQPTEAPPQQTEVVVDRPSKRVRLDYNGHVVRPTDVTPPLSSTPAKLENIEPLPEPILGPPDELPTLPPPAIPDGRRMERTHSLAMSDLSVGDIANEDFVNPFENELAEFAEFFGPRPGVVKDTSVSSDMGGLGALKRNAAEQGAAGTTGSSSSSSSSSTGVRQWKLNASRERRSSASPTFLNGSRYGFPTDPALFQEETGNDLQYEQRPHTSSSLFHHRSLSALLSDLPDSRHDHEERDVDFWQGINTINDALHPDVEEEKIPTHLFPYRGNAFRNLRRSSTSTSSSKTMHRGFDGRQ